MPIVCIPKETANKVREGLKTKDITVSKLLEFKDSEARISFLEKYAGKDATAINALFEQKIILKNQYAGLKNFISKITATGRYSKEKIAELQQALEEFKAQQTERIFNPKEGETVLNSLIEKIVGTELTDTQRVEVAKLTMAANDLKKNFVDGKWTSEQAAHEYGASRVLLENYINKVKTGGLSLKGMLQDRLSQFKEEYKTNKPMSVVNMIKDFVNFVSDNSISMVATFDNSFMGRQGLKTLMTHPKTWWKEDVLHSFDDIYKVLKGENARDALWADIYSRPNYLNGTYKKSGVIPEWEEQYPSSLPANIPLLGRAFRASEQAFTGSAIRSRTALLDMMLEKAEKNGVEINDYQIKSIGKMVSALTARGQWGKTGEPAIVKMILWAPKMLKANIDVLTAHTGQDISPFARKEAALNLLKIVGTTATIMTIANAMKPGSAELDPRSSDFGKIRVGNTRFDITGGASSLLVLAARLATGELKSTNTGEIRKSGTGFGEQNRFDYFMNFLVGKTTPPTRAIIDIMKGQNAEGKVVTPLTIAEGMVVPISIQNAIDLKDEASVQSVLGAILDVVGINANTWSTATDWEINAGKETDQFKQKVGEQKFKEANEKYNMLFNQWYLAVNKNPQYLKLTPEEKQKIITKEKSEIKDKVFKSYGFKYKSAPTRKLPNF